jgi:1,4-alpha-glucan branching enzyme
MATNVDYSKATDGTRVIADDPWLEPYAPVLRARYAKFQATKKDIEEKEGSLGQFALGYKHFGFNRVGKSIVYREWAPGAQELYVIGDFSTQCQGR